MSNLIVPPAYHRAGRWGNSTHRCQEVIYSHREEMRSLEKNYFLRVKYMGLPRLPFVSDELIFGLFPASPVITALLLLL
jgi:hypothetical protein